MSKNPANLAQKLSQWPATAGRSLRQHPVRWILTVLLIGLTVWLGWPFVALLGHANDVRDLLQLAPGLAGLNGPRTYLILVQNEDELRATGGYITAAGTVTIERGRITRLAIEDSFAIDNPKLHYPLPPEPLHDYMDAPYWVLRDANWSPDFPTAAAVAEAFYTATRPQDIDGVVALDQTFLRIMLQATGPIQVPEFTQRINADNVVALLRAAREPPPGETVSYEWWLHRKDSVPAVAQAMIHRLPWSNWGLLARAAIRALDERHLMLTVNDPGDATILAKHGWDGALRPGSADYLMLVEANIGFNKVNAVEQTRLDYQVDLSQPGGPTGTVTVTQTNPAEGTLPCDPGPDYGSGSYAELIARCYWSYVRVYTQQAADFQGGTAQSVAGALMPRGEPVTGTISVAPGENGAQSLGALSVVPFASTGTTTFSYRLAPGAVTAGSEPGLQAYHLKLQKQGGISGLPITLVVKLPAGAASVSGPAGGRRDGDTWRLDLLLVQDTEVALSFRLP
ncbi:MAG: DUF4012 domain-containing protein, partial [Anaerolineales bacterium]